MYNCKLCGGINSLIKDYNSNYIKCNNCEATIKENDNEDISEFQKYFSPNNKTIEYMNTKEEDNTIPQKIQKSKTQNKKDSNPFETKMNNKIEDFSKKMDLSQPIIDKVKELTKKVFDSKKIKFKLLESVIASVIFVVCRNEEEPKTMQEISTQLELDRRAVNRCYNSIRDSITENKNQIPQTVSRLISSYCDKILDNNNEKLKKLSCDISDNVCKYELIAGRNPTTIAAACILIGDRLLELKIGKKNISKKVGTTENTISSAFCILKEYIDSIVPIEFKDELYLLNEI